MPCIIVTWFLDVMVPKYIRQRKMYNVVLNVDLTKYIRQRKIYNVVLYIDLANF